MNGFSKQLARGCDTLCLGICDTVLLMAAAFVIIIVGIFYGIAWLFSGFFDWVDEDGDEDKLHGIFYDR